MSGSARIEVVAGNAAGTWLDVTRDQELLIGRHADGHGRLGDDEELSRYHARVSLGAGDSCTVEDLKSTNGTFVNGVRISGAQALKPGDTIQLGGSTLVVREMPPLATADQSGDTPAEPEGQPAPEPAAPAQPVPVPEPPVPEPVPPVPQPVPVPEPPPPQPLPTPEPPAPLPAPTPEPAAPQAGPTPEPAAPQPGLFEPERQEEPAPPAAVPPLSLRLEIDFATNEALISLGEDAEPIRIVLESGAWRIA